MIFIVIYYINSWMKFHRNLYQIPKKAKIPSIKCELSLQEKNYLEINI